MAQGLAGGSHESAVIGDRFQLGRPPTILARTASVAPIGFTRLKNGTDQLGRSVDPLIGVDQTWLAEGRNGAIDPKPTSALAAGAV
jgi:hypothetical protein